MEEHIKDIVDELKVSTYHKDISDAIEDLENATKELERREKVIQIIETLALESNDPNIILLREELFTTVKLVHSDEIQETLVKMEEYSPLVTFNTAATSSTLTMSGFSASMATVDEVDTLSDKVYNKNTVLTKIRKLLRMKD